MKNSLLLPMLTLALIQTATAADPAVPMADLEPQLPPSSGAPAVSPPAGALLDDFALGAHTTQAPAASPAAVGRDDEYRSAPQPMPVLEGF